jgi:CRP/FNR family transcriptional regulator, cyclic AMP receptor protein
VFNPAPFTPLVESAPKRRYRKGTLIIQEGDTGNTIYAVISGSVRSFSASWDDKEITFGVYGPGALFGELSLDGEPRSTSVETLEVTECAVIEHDLLVRFLVANPAFSLELVKLVVLRARQATQAARNMALLDVYGRVKFLLENAPADVLGSERTLLGRLTQREIAQRIGSSREMVSRVFTELERGGYIDTRESRFIVKRALPDKW